VNQRSRLLQSSTDSNLADVGRNGKGVPATYGPASSQGSSPMVLGGLLRRLRCSRSDAVGVKLDAAPAERSTVNVGTANALALVTSGWTHGQSIGCWWGGVPVVVRGRESRPHGEGGQQERGCDLEGRRSDAE
jgi:hypothetical protein